MRTPFILLFLAAAGAAFAETALPRNPFWPQGYEGVRYPIGPEPRLAPDAVKEAEAAAAAAAEPKAVAPEEAQEAAEKPPEDPREAPIWNDAVKALEFGSTMSFTVQDQAQKTIMINGRTYVVGDLVSANYRGYRFTWRIEKFTADEKVSLNRITYRKIGVNP